MKIKKIAFTVIIIAACIFALQLWFAKPYCTVEFLDAQTIRGKQMNPFIYAITKLISQRRELSGNDPYKMYVYINDPDGIKSVVLRVDGKTIPLEINNSLAIEHEFNGDTEYGLHRYTLEVIDRKNNKGYAESLIKVSPGPGVIVPMI